MILFTIACESDPIIVDSNFTNNNSLFSETFYLDSFNQNSKTIQDLAHSSGQSYRLYAGKIDQNSNNLDIISRILFRINLDDLRESKYCNIDGDNLTDSTIESLDSIKITFKSFTQLMDEDSSLIINIDALEVKGAFLTVEDWDEDSLSIYTSPTIDNNEFVSIINSDATNIEIDEYQIKLGLPLLDTEWCGTQGQYFISLDYVPLEGDELQYIEMTSSQYSAGFSTLFRPSLEISYNEFELNTEFIDRFSINEMSSVGNSSINDNIYFVNNDTLSTNSNILIIRNMIAGFQDSINIKETYLYDVSIDADLYFGINSTEDPYKLDITLELNDALEDSIDAIDFIIDNIIIAPDLNDPEGDNYPNGLELNGQWDSLNVENDSIEVYYDMGIDQCPNLFESGNGDCLCDYTSDSEECDNIENYIYNATGTEGNGMVDLNEYFPDSLDCGVDGACDEDEPGYDSETNPDPNMDNYLLDPARDDWLDCGTDEVCDEDEPGYDSETNPDPNMDNWGSENFEGTEGNGVWDFGEGTEGNGQYDNGEPYSDFGTDGLPQEQEESCVDCSEDGSTEDNNQYDLGEPFQDTGDDGFYSTDEDSYNPNGTEGNNIQDDGEIFPLEYDCGTDGLCNEDEEGYDENINKDPNLDDYNIDPNNDNWNDCGSDADCDIDDEDGTQGNELWNENENFENNSKYDIGEHYYDWGVDQTPDSLEILSNDYTLSYSAPQTISYQLGQDLILDDNFDASRDIIFVIKSITPHETSPNSILINLHIFANANFSAMQFKLNHSPFIYQATSSVHHDESLYSLDENQIIEDISLYNNRFDNYDFQIDNTLTADYMNGIKFTLDFDSLDEFINNNAGVYISKSYTTLSLYINHEHTNHNFFEGNVNLWLNLGDQNRFLTSFPASSNTEILVPFGSVIEDMIDGDIDPSIDMTFVLDGVYDNRSRIVFYKNDHPPILEVFYSE